MPLLPEVIGGTVQPGNVVNPIRRVIQRVNVVVGRLDTIDEKNNVVKGVRKNGEKIELNYDSLILAPSSKSSFSTIPGMITHGYPIDTVGDALRIRQRVIDLVEEAEFSDHVDEKKRLLTFVIVGSGETASAVAVEVCQMLLTAESSYPVLRESNWQVHLYEDTEHNDSDFEKQTSEMRTSCLEKAGVILHKDDKITNISQTDIIFDKSNYLPVGLVVNAAFVYPSVPFLYSGIINLPFSITDNLNLINHKNIWITEVNSTSKNPQHLFINDRIALGSTAGYNAWASSQGFTPHPYIQKKHIIKPYNMRHHSICYVGGIGFSGNLAWFVSRLINLLSVPGLERNLRILIDWLLVIPFRNDIAILAQATSYKLQRTQYKKGDEIYRQDDLAEHAYAVETGRLEVIQDGRKTKELAPGDYFGEILSLHLGRREETVRCLSPSELTVVAQEDFKALTQGGSLMGKAMRNLAEYRSTESSEEDTLGLKRITYVSKLNAPLNEADILEIGRLASLNNRKIDVTGILISVHGYFFQILEGEESIVDKLVEKISRDNRHAELTILSAESECEEHIFSEWSMKTVALSESKDHMLQAISIMLQNIAQSHSAIGHYTQPIIFKFLTEGINPLTIPVKSTKKIVLSGSMIDFSNLFEQFHYEDVVQAINTYLETCSASIIQHGGQIAKYSGDSVIAHFSLKQTDAAIAACMDISRKMTVLKKNSAIFSLIHFHYGIISGAMIEGNIGSSIKMDYTVLGSTIHRAVRLGMVARETNNAIAISENIQQMADPSWGFQYAGEFLLNQQGELSRRLSEN